MNWVFVYSNRPMGDSFDLLGMPRAVSSRHMRFLPNLTFQLTSNSAPVELSMWSIVSVSICASYLPSSCLGGKEMRSGFVTSRHEMRLITAKFAQSAWRWAFCNLLLFGLVAPLKDLNGDKDPIVFHNMNQPLIGPFECMCEAFSLGRAGGLMFDSVSSKTNHPNCESCSGNYDIRYCSKWRWI